MEQDQPYCVAVFGGAVSGSEATRLLTEQGIRVFVFEQDSLPYGKIEYGLPKWHIKLRDENERRIDEVLCHPLVTYVPHAPLGKLVDFLDLTKDWGFDAILLATGAWADRPLAVAGAEKFIDNGIYYQNPFVMWFNQNHDPDYGGQEFPIMDNALVIGGGLASIDVVKILSIEVFLNKIREKGHDFDLFTLERKGVAHACETLGINYKDLGIKGCTLVYRRRLIDMPISPMNDNPAPEDLEKAALVRNKLMNIAMDKFGFHFKELLSAYSVVENGEGNFEGIRFHKNKMENGKLTTDEGSDVALKHPMVISSIGSIPEKIQGLSYNGEKLEFENEDLGKIKGFENVYALGNAVTGKGNIKESKHHGEDVTLKLIESLRSRKGMATPELISAIDEKVKPFQKECGYLGNYAKWIGKTLPVRLENQIGYSA